MTPLSHYTATVLAQALLLALGLATSLTLTRALGPAGFGAMTATLATAQALVWASGFWLTAGTLRYGAARAQLGPVVWARLLIAGGLAGLLMAALGAYLELVVVPVVIVLLVGQSMHAAWQAHGASGVAAGLLVAERAVFLGLLVGIGVSAPSTALWLAASAGAIVLVPGLLGLRALWPIRTSRATMGRLLAFSWPLAVAMLAQGATSSWLTVAVLQQTHGPATVGQWALVQQIAGAVQQIPAASFPIVVAGRVGAPEALGVYLARVVPLGLLACAALVGLALLALPRLVAMLYGPDFEPARRVLPILLLGIGAYAVYIAALPLLTLAERSTAVLGVTAVAALVHVAALALLVPTWGLAGAAWASTASQGASAVAVVGLTCRGRR